MLHAVEMIILHRVPLTYNLREQSNHLDIKFQVHLRPSTAIDAYFSFVAVLLFGQYLNGYQIPFGEDALAMRGNTNLLESV